MCGDLSLLCYVAMCRSWVVQRSVALGLFIDLPFVYYVANCRSWFVCVGMYVYVYVYDYDYDYDYDYNADDYYYVGLIIAEAAQAKC